jgi:excisionase family DNA binding protein
MDYFNLKQIAKKIGVSVVTIRRYIKSGKLNAKKIGRDYRISSNDLSIFLNAPNKSKTFRINNQLENHGNKSISIFPGLNFHVMEALAEMSSKINSLDEIRDIVSRHDHVCLEFLERIEKNDTDNPSTAITFLLIDDAIRNLQTRRRLFKNLIDKKGIILLPLPPHLSDSLLRIVPKDMIFLSDEALPPHLKSVHYDDINLISSPELIKRITDLKLLVTEGYVENQEIYFRRSVINTIYNLSFNGLKEVFIHNIPHIPPHAEFIKFDKKNVDMEISMI